METAHADAAAKPNDPDAVGRYGMVLQAHDQFAAAGQAYRRAQILDPKRRDWPYLRGVALLANGKAGEAATCKCWG